MLNCLNEIPEQLTKLTEDDYQPWPVDLVLSQNLNRELPGFQPNKQAPAEWIEGEPDFDEKESNALSGSAAKSGMFRSAVPSPVIAYILTTVEWDSGLQCLKQTGSAPNFQGGRVSLCTCRPDIRTWQQNWQKVWIAGFAGKEATDQYLQRHPARLAISANSKLRILFYLMQVAFSKPSHSDLWNEQAYLIARSAKDASVHKFGDLYKPKRAVTAWHYCPESYVSPIPKHVHCPDAWRIDISGTHDRKHPALLVGDPRRSFIWTGTKPGYLSDQVRRHKIFPTLSDFYSALI